MSKASELNRKSRDLANIEGIDVLSESRRLFDYMAENMKKEKADKSKVIEVIAIAQIASLMLCESFKIKDEEVFDAAEEILNRKERSNSKKES